MDVVEVLRVLGNKYNPEILQATNTPKSAQELSDELDIPIATSYRRIEELTENDLLTLEGKQVSREGRQTKVYRRQVDELTFAFEGEDLTIDLKERTEAKNQLVDVWSDLQQRG
ncbi:MAG: ArsR/SmtB family transcription factor [Halodesulfurarchaeum sp.]